MNWIELKWSSCWLSFFNLSLKFATLIWLKRGLNHLHNIFKSEIFKLIVIVTSYVRINMLKLLIHSSHIIENYLELSGTIKNIVELYITFQKRHIMDKEQNRITLEYPSVFHGTFLILLLSYHFCCLEYSELYLYNRCFSRFFFVNRSYIRLPCTFTSSIIEY